jgi:hypothetical protein
LVERLAWDQEAEGSNPFTLIMSTLPVGHAESEWVSNNAYLRSQAAGFPIGRDLEFWLAAKNEFSLLYYGVPFPHVLHPVTGVYRHFKGELYTVEGVGKLHLSQLAHSETMAEYVIYRNGSGQFYVRPIGMFQDHIERDGYKGPRFTLVQRTELHRLNPKDMVHAVAVVDVDGND